MIEFEGLNGSVKLAVLFSGIYLFVGMLTGVWKYWQITQSSQARAHYYVDIAHRSSLLYAPASLILAVMAYFSYWNENVNLLCVILNLIFFTFSILSYVVHGILQDTSNQFKNPHHIGTHNIPAILVKLSMLFLIISELVATGILLLGIILNF